MRLMLITCLLMSFVIGSTANHLAANFLTPAALASTPVAETPSFIKVGKTYEFGTGGSSFRVVVLEMGSQGWIKVAARRLDTQREPFTGWLNVNQAIWFFEV